MMGIWWEPIVKDMTKSWCIYLPTARWSKYRDNWTDIDTVLGRFNCRPTLKADVNCRSAGFGDLFDDEWVEAMVTATGAIISIVHAISFIARRRYSSSFNVLAIDWLQLLHWLNYKIEWLELNSLNLQVFGWLRSRTEFNSINSPSWLNR